MELWDIYDKNKQPTGRTMVRNDWCLKDDEYHLSVLGVLVREDGRVLITQRVMSKQWAAGWWEVPGGGVRAGETSREAVCREVQEETGIDVRKAPCELFMTYHRENPGQGDNYFVDVYRFRLHFEEKDIHLQEEETLAYEIADVKRIEELARQGIFLHYDSIRKVFDTI